VPLQPARQFLQEHPEAKLDLIFPEAYAEDRSAKLKDLGTAQGLNYFTHQRAATQAAQEFGFEQFDYATEMDQIRLEKKKWGDILGAGDELAARVAGAPSARPALPDDEDEPEQEPHRADLSGPARARFKRQQREVVIVRQDAQGRMVGFTEGVDPEEFYRQRRETLVRQREQEQAAQREQLGEELANTADVLAEARAQTTRLPEAPKPRFTKDQVSYRYSGASEQLDRGLPVTACGTCTRYLPPPTPSQPARCQIVEPPIQGNGYCDQFERRPAR
jgi:hypothetical protein